MTTRDQWLLALGDPTDGGLHPTELPYEKWLEEQLEALRFALEDIAGEDDEPDVRPSWYRDRARTALNPASRSDE